MSKTILPFLSGTLNAIIEEVAKKGDVIAKEIYRINSLVEDVLKVYPYLPTNIKEAIIEKIINVELTDEVSMLSCRIGSNDANVSFLPKGKEPEYTGDGIWARRNRQEGKPAKIFQKALVKQFKQAEWENFANSFKSETCACNNFEIVSGEDIRKWYHDINYYECKGTLGNSCMRYGNAQDFFDVYVDHAKMLITKKNGLLTGRALVWEIDENITLLDRIYTCFDYLTNCFIDYAKDHKWYIREDNGLLHTGDQQHWFTPDDDYSVSKFFEFNIQLSKDYEYFPYVDSFRYFDSHHNILTTRVSDCALDSTDGEIERACFSCENCGNTFYGYDEDNLPDEVHWSDWGDCYVCDSCSYWCELLEDYIPDHVSNTRIYRDVDFYSYDYIPTEIINEYLVENPENEYDSNPIIKIDDHYFYLHCVKRDVFFNLETNNYEIRSDANSGNRGSTQSTQLQTRITSSIGMEGGFEVDECPF